MIDTIKCDCELCEAERMTRAPENMPPPKKITISDLLSARVEEAMDEAEKEIDKKWKRGEVVVVDDTIKIIRKALRKIGVLKCQQTKR